jgi:hypothetical protein
MAQVSLSDILSLLGEQCLHDRYQDSKTRFRRFISQPKFTPQDFKPWIDECLEKGSSARPAYFYAFQDMVVSIGAHLGMSVEYGLYARSQDIGYDGRWTAADGRIILLEVKTSPWPVPSVHQLGTYMSRYAAHSNVDPAMIYGLFVIGPGDFTPVLDQIKGSEYRTRMKMIEVSDLLSLWQLHIDLRSRLGAEQVSYTVQNLLFPFESVNVGALLELIREVARRANSEAEKGEDEVQYQPQEWGRSELIAVLDAAAPAQRTLVAALCAINSEAATSLDVVALMRAVGRECPGLLPPESISQRTFSGAVSSLHRLCHEKNRETFFERTVHGYRIREHYLEWITEWAMANGLFVANLPHQYRLQPDVETEDL